MIIITAYDRFLQHYKLFWQNLPFTWCDLENRGPLSKYLQLQLYFDLLSVLNLGRTISEK